MHKHVHQRTVPPPCPLLCGPGSVGCYFPLPEEENNLLAAPSWVVPGTLWENCLFLEGKVAEVALLFLEAEASLGYGRQDLPPELARLRLRYHVHLPVDLPWEAGGDIAGRICCELMAKVDFLGASRAVLHPPPAKGEAGKDGAAPCLAALEAFAGAWQKAGRSCGDLFLENTRENDLTALFGLVDTKGFGLCPDLGHILAHAQWNFLSLLSRLPERARPRMLHCSAPGSGLPGEAPRSAHLPLDCLDQRGRSLGARLCSLLAPGGVVVAELFDWNFILRSVPLLAAWRGEGEGRNHGLFPEDTENTGNAGPVCLEGDLADPGERGS